MIWKASWEGSVWRVLGTLALMLTLFPSTPLSASQPQQSIDYYTNPVSPTDTFADPAVILAKDGYWYAYGTTDAVLESRGDTSLHYLPISRSRDLVHWEYVGDVFDASNDPDWMPIGAGTFYWAPDVRYLNGLYYLYYAAVHFPEFTNAIGVATAPTPLGPWTDSGEPIIRGQNGYTAIDPALFMDQDGSLYLYYGSFNQKGIGVVRLSPDGKRAIGETLQVVRTGEAPYPIRRGDYYYLMFSDSSCCNGELSGYEVYVGRSTSPLGPFVDREGIPLTASRMGGTFVIAANGNKWVGPGHNSVAKDLSGQDWFVYHAIDRNNPYLDNGAPRRPLMIDRLDWIDGWPTVRAGAWASVDRQRTPVTTWEVGSHFNGIASLGRGWKTEGGARSAWRLVSENDQGYVRHDAISNKQSFLVTKERTSVNSRVEADLRISPTSNGAVGVVFAYINPANYVAAWIDKEANALVTDVLLRGRSWGQVETPLPTGFDFEHWHNLAVEVRNGVMYVEVTNSRLFDPAARQQRALPNGVMPTGAIGALAIGGSVDVDNLGAARIYTPVTEPVQAPTVGQIDPNYSDEFEGVGDPAENDPAWSWVRAPDGAEGDGVFLWETQNADLYVDSNNASVLLRDAPPGDFTVETKVTLDVGMDTDRSYQQAGLVVYVNDDEYIKLVHVAISTSRRVEYAKEKPTGVRYGNMFVGPPADTTWLRISRRVDPSTGEQLYRAATSRDGEHWIWGGVWTMPAGVTPKIGLVSMAACCAAPGEPQTATALFDYFRVYRP